MFTVFTEITFRKYNVDNKKVSAEAIFTILNMSIDEARKIVAETKKNLNISYKAYRDSTATHKNE